MIVNFHLGVVPAAVSALRRWRLDGQESQASLGYMERCLELTAFFFFLKVNFPSVTCATSMVPPFIDLAPGPAGMNLRIQF